MLETRISTGLVRGKMTNTEGIVSFLGIPFAAPPVGELRWRAPEKPQPWDGVRECFDYGYSCWQRDNSQSPYFLKCMCSGCLQAEKCQEGFYGIRLEKKIQS